MSKILLISGLCLIALGILAHFHLLNFFQYLGHLPGDIYYKKGNTTIFIPITTCLLISLIVSLVIFFIRKV
jgi:hypothetical protein